MGKWGKSKISGGTPDGMVWYGMVWYGMVWYGVVWYGMVLHKVTISQALTDRSARLCHRSGGEGVLDIH